MPCPYTHLFYLSQRHPPGFDEIISSALGGTVIENHKEMSRTPDDVALPIHAVIIRQEGAAEAGIGEEGFGFESREAGWGMMLSIANNDKAILVAAKGFHLIPF